MDILLIVDDQRAELRDNIRLFIKSLLDEKGYSIGEIISELLIASAVSITSDEVPVSTAYLTNEERDEIEDEDEDEDEDDIFDDTETPEERKERHDMYARNEASENEFNSLAVTKSIEKHRKSLEKYMFMKKHKEIFEADSSSKCNFDQEMVRGEVR